MGGHFFLAVKTSPAWLDTVFAPLLPAVLFRNYYSYGSNTETRTRGRQEHITKPCKIWLMGKCHQPIHFGLIRKSGVLWCDELVEPANAAKGDESLLICYTQRTVG